MTYGLIPHCTEVIGMVEVLTTQVMLKDWIDLSSLPVEVFWGCIFQSMNGIITVMLLVKVITCNGSVN